MGQCIFKDTTNKHKDSINLINNNSSDSINLINNNSSDKIILTIKGIYNNNNIPINSISINKMDYITTINFYEDYLIISNINYYENISYYNIKSWGFKESINVWSFYKIDKIDNNNLKLYEFYLNNEYISNQVSKLLLTIIKDHIKYKDNL
jgi:hypothetical protein